MNARDILLTNKKIGVLMGGVSAEREVSLRSGKAVFNALKNLGYNVVSMDVSSNVCEELKRERIEMAFLVLHGGWGRGWFNTGASGCDGHSIYRLRRACVCACNEQRGIQKIFLYHKIPVPPFAVISRKALSSQLSAVGFSLPWVVKPASEGSSVGVSIIKNKKQVKAALEKCFEYGREIIVEKYIKGKEAQIGILNDKSLGGVEVRPSLEFYNYEAKYTPGLLNISFLLG